MIHVSTLLTIIGAVFLDCCSMFHLWGESQHVSARWYGDHCLVHTALTLRPSPKSPHGPNWGQPPSSPPVVLSVLMFTPDTTMSVQSPVKARIDHCQPSREKLIGGGGAITLSFMRYFSSFVTLLYYNLTNDYIIRIVLLTCKIKKTTHYVFKTLLLFYNKVYNTLQHVFEVEIFFFNPEENENERRNTGHGKANTGPRHELKINMK